MRVGEVYVPGISRTGPGNAAGLKILGCGDFLDSHSGPNFWRLKDGQFQMVWTILDASNMFVRCIPSYRKRFRKDGNYYKEVRGKFMAGIPSSVKEICEIYRREMCKYL